MNMPEREEGLAALAKQMDHLGLKGAYNPKNHYLDSPFTPSSNPTATEVQQQATCDAEKILSDWRVLQQIVERHYDVLAKRWAKKTRKKQKDLLLSAWPNMPPTHRPDWEAYRQENTGRSHTGLSEYQDAYKWPYINQNDLSSKSLLIFINSRARHPPSAFARADIDATRLGTVGHFVEEPAFLLDYTLFMDGDTVDTYGKLVAWDDDGKVVRLMLTQRQFTPGDGLKVFELQEKIYPFLIKCCELILHDIVETGSLLDAQFPVIPDAEPDLAASVTTEILPSLASISAEAPYKLPANLDLGRLRGVLAARLSVADDHLWLLRQDPGYFADTILDWSEHRMDRLLDTAGNPHPTGPHTVDFWQRVVMNAISDAYASLERWSLLHKQIDRLLELKNKYKDTISYESQLPEEYLIAILRLRQLLDINCETPISNLKTVQSSPPLREFFARMPQQPGTSDMRIGPINGKPPLFHKPWACLLILWDEQQRELFGLSNIVDAFEHIMQDPEERKNLSPYMANQFADLAISSRALHEIENYRPWAATFEDDYKRHAEEVLQIMHQAPFQMDYIEYIDYVFNGIVPLAMPGDGKFDYPIDKKRTKDSTEAMRTAEKNLDLFWSKFDASWIRLAKKSIAGCMGEHKPRPKEEPLERTVPWVEPVKNKPQVDVQREPKVAKRTKGDDTAGLSKKKATTKATTKSIGRHIEEAALLTVPDESTNISDKQPKFKVDKSALKVFNTLFFQPGQVGSPGEIPWIEFLRAMSSIGFTSQKLYGSLWHFTPTKLDLGKSIQFHEPHPAVKISFTVARRMGRRLTWAYGWHGDMFELE